MSSIARLQEENELLREQVAQLRQALQQQVMPPHGCHLTPSQLTIFRHLMLGRVTSRDQLLTILYAHKSHEPESYYLLNVFISQLRRKLAGHGFVIETLYGQGWRMVSKQAEAV